MFCRLHKHIPHKGKLCPCQTSTVRTNLRHLEADEIIVPPVAAVCVCFKKVYFYHLGVSLIKY